MKILGIFLLLLLSVAVNANAINAEIERKIIQEVAKQYGLSQHQTQLLLAIRKVENGAPGLEFGVGQDIKNHPAKRYRHDPLKSLRLQASWAAGTIKKRYHGDLKTFSKIYCPYNSENWYKLVKGKL